MKRYLFIIIKERNGEQEYYQNSVHEVDLDTNIHAYCIGILEDWYEDFTGMDENWAEYGWGERMAKILDCREIPEEHYNILKEYI